MLSHTSVSYTHLDVYKRQALIIKLLYKLYLNLIMFDIKCKQIIIYLLNLFFLNLSILKKNCVVDVTELHLQGRKRKLYNRQYVVDTQSV